MPSHVVWRILWGLTWRWLILLASLNMQVPPVALPVMAVLLAAGLIASVWGRHDLLGSAWRLLLAVAIVNLGFWLGTPLLVPAITLAICLTIGDLWWSIGGVMLEGAGQEEPERIPPVVPEPWLISAAQTTPPRTLSEPRRRRASRGRTSGGFRLLLAACLLLAIAVVTAPAIASTLSGKLTTALSSIGQPVSMAPTSAPSPTSRPAATAAPSPAPTPSDPGTALAPFAQNGLCVSLPDGRYEVQLPNGQVIVVTTRHRAGCPDLGAILKALQNAGGGSD